MQKANLNQKQTKEYTKKRQRMNRLILANNLSCFAFFPGSFVIMGLVYIRLPHTVPLGLFLSALGITLGWMFLSLHLLLWFHSEVKKLMNEVLTKEEKLDYALRQALDIKAFVGA